jgi:ribosomal protein S18 acetylase RimI-like enzyme
MPRLFLVRSTAAPIANLANIAFCTRLIRDSDIPGLAGVLFRAYEHGPEQEEQSVEEGAEEVGRCLDGSYGPFMANASFVAVDDRDVAVAACLVTLQDDLPLLAHVVVEPEQRSVGIGSVLINDAISALHHSGHEYASLAVAAANVAACRLYLRLGFRLYVEGGEEGWLTDAMMHDAESHIGRSLGDFTEPQTFAVALLPANRSDPVLVPRINNDGFHRLPFYPLAAVSGYRHGSDIVELHEKTLAAAVALLEPAEPNTDYSHPNLHAWRSILEFRREGDRIVALFDEQRLTEPQVLEKLEAVRR